MVNAGSTEPWLTSQVDGRTSEKVASAWSWNALGTTLHLTLRKDVFFHDGTRLTPESAVAAFKASMAVPRSPSSFSSVRSVTASGDGLDITLSEPNSFFLPDLSLTAVTLPGKQDIATGPFTVNRSESRQVALQAFQQYYRGRPTVTAIDIINYPTQRNAWAALMRGEVDVLYEVGRDIADFVEAGSTIKTYTFPRPYYNSLVFNERHPVLKRADVRRAINEALDRPTLIRDGLNGRGRPADGPLVPEHWAYSPPPESFEFNPATARMRLDNAGLRTRPGTGGRMPSRLSFTCLVFADDPRFERLAILVAKQLADVGVDMRLEPLPLKAFVGRIGAGDFDAFLFEMAGRSLSWVYEFWHSHEQGMINPGYRSADAVLDRIRGARTEDEIRRGVAELQRILHDDPPAAFLSWQTTTRAVSTKFDVAFEADRDIFGNLWKWRPASARQAER